MIVGRGNSADGRNALGRLAASRVAAFFTVLILLYEGIAL
jgi:hypothetical protein